MKQENTNASFGDQLERIKLITGKKPKLNSLISWASGSLQYQMPSGVGEFLLTG